MGSVVDSALFYRLLGTTDAQADGGQEEASDAACAGRSVGDDERVLRVPGCDGVLFEFKNASAAPENGTRSPAGSGYRAGTVDVHAGTGDTTDADVAVALPAFVGPAPILITTAAELDAALPALRAASVLGLDTETTGLDPLSDRLRLVQLATPDAVYVVDCFRVDARALAPVLRAGPRLVGHNLRFELGFLAAAGLPVPDGGRLFDTMLAAQLLGAGTEEGRLDRCGLKTVVERVLGLVLPKEEQRSDWAGPLSDGQVRYAARDAAVVLQLAARLEADLDAAGLARVAAIEFRCLPGVAWLVRTGAPFDASAWVALSDSAVAEQARLEAEMTALIGSADMFGQSSLKWGSPAQVAGLLRSRGHAVENTDETTLQGLVDREPLAGLLLKYRDANKRASTYGIDFLKHVHRTTGRIHADYLQLGSAAGRMSCQRPNLQQIPRDRAYRACVRPPDGRVLVKVDYSQIELRIAAEVSGDRRLLEAYAQGEDVHRLTAAAVLGRDPSALTRDDRQAAKALNFGLIYGMGPATLRTHAAGEYGVAMTDAEAQAFHGRFFATYPGLRRWHRAQPREPMDTRTLAGRRRLGVEPFTHKVNTPVQGTGADGLKCALALLWERRDRCPSAVPVLVVHDEIVVECDAGDADAATTWLTEAMKEGMQWLLKTVPVAVEAATGRDWSMP